MDVTRGIRELILAGELVPNQRLVEADLVEQFQVSRAAVREALSELVSEGLVERIQNRGARVRTITLEAAIQITEARSALESLCAEKAALLITDEEIAELRRIGADMSGAVQEGDLGRYSLGNRELHTRVNQISRQDVVMELLERLNGQSVRHQYRLALKPGRPAVSLPEHLAIIDAITRRDPRAAAEAMRAHLSSVIDALREFDATVQGEKRT
ncbi:GntR family transcriptional regulator [Streptomyces xiamenensis]|jgi:DNA-binding GntR family transcriptional regulator|uniref:Transcriptional regulator n=1 Tax=Streptomyces xiamenensis TaxID=408015 RepID=A0A0F7G242_9ACTN|nr:MULTISPECIES: GntR family transcriptional regulator [Streptomyces]AKG46600.1 transcriptional regulator [Streptomyces xiamenensis]